MPTQPFPFLTRLKDGVLRDSFTLVWRRLNQNIAVSQLTGYIVRETPSGVQDSSNPRFFLSQLPVEGSEMVFVNGALIIPPDYQIQDTAIVFGTPPAPGDWVRVSYLSATAQP